MGTLLWWTVGGALVLLLRKAVNFVIRPYLSPLRSLPGPPSPSWLWGEMKHMMAVSDVQEEWFQQYGKTIVSHGLFNV